MLTVDEAQTIADTWRPRFVDEQDFELSWTRFFDKIGDPTPSKLEAWLAKDQARDAVKHAGIVREPVLPTRQRFTVSDCHHCHGHRYVRRDVDIDHPDFGKAHPCPACNR